VTPLASFLFLAVTVGFLWTLYLVLDFVCGCIEAWWVREMQAANGEDAKATEGKAN